MEIKTIDESINILKSLFQNSNIDYLIEFEELLKSDLNVGIKGFSLDKAKDILIKESEDKDHKGYIAIWYLLKLLTNERV